MLRKPVTYENLPMDSNDIEELNIITAQTYLKWHFFPKICKSCAPDWKDALLKKVTKKAVIKEVFMTIIIMFYKRHQTTATNITQCESTMLPLPEKKKQSPKNSYKLNNSQCV
jgi:hypothetical protein